MVDLHAITLPHEPRDLLEATRKSAALYIASGINPDKASIFVQSHVSAHAELAWLLQCYTPIGQVTCYVRTPRVDSLLPHQTPAQVPEHNPALPDLQRAIGCVLRLRLLGHLTHFGVVKLCHSACRWLRRMIQFKEKSQSQASHNHSMSS